MNWVRLGSHLVGWIWLGQRKWTHGQRRLLHTRVIPLSHLRTDAADRGGCSIGRDPRGIRTVCVLYPYCLWISAAVRRDLQPNFGSDFMFHACCGWCG